MKTVNIEKVKREFSKANTPEKLTAYEELGEWLHNEIQKERDIKAQEDAELRELQLKLKTNTNEGN